MRKIISVIIVLAVIVVGAVVLLPSFVGWNQYKGMATEKVRELTGRELKIAWDAGNGSAGEAMADLASRLPGQHILLNEKIDGTFPVHHPDPTVVENLEQLRDVVTGEGCDLGIAFDGDGDRIGVIDGDGEILTDQGFDDYPHIELRRVA